MAHIILSMPRCGEDGVIIATRGDGYVVEFRGRPYTQWELGEDTPFFKIHSVLERVNISDLHCNRTQTVTSQPGIFPEWAFINAMFEAALQGDDGANPSSS